MMKDKERAVFAWHPSFPPIDKEFPLIVLKSLYSDS